MTNNAEPAGVTVPPEVWAQMQQILASFGPLQGMITPAVPPLAPITTSFTPLAPINPVALASSDTITSQSGQIDLPPAVAPSDSFTDHESELDQSPSDSISAMFNDNEEKDTTPSTKLLNTLPRRIAPFSQLKISWP
ncbi:hypothetical protein PSTT_12344 [Puccinia striiformis]|uniref:Uncharacterized protein n=1 Tax=Puccinia striiformis TaxID=27350 RepID=A0A2S4UWV0_9BASI|nr:hypothetical protein PSTT_12344 [Puccinia striiformis]